MKRDLLLLTPLAGLVVLLVVMLAFRDLRVTLALFVPLVISNALLFGLMGALGYPLNPLTAVLPALLGVMGVADGMHIVSKYRSSGATSPQLRALEALEATGGACVVTTITTVIAFGSLWFTSLPILKEFGAFAAIGIGISLVCVLALVPGGLVLLSVSADTPVGTRTQHIGARWGAWITSGRRPVIAALISAIFFAGAVSTSTSARLDQFLADTLDADHPVAIANTLLEEHLGGLMPLEISLTGPEELFRGAEGLRRISELESWIRQREGSEVSISLASVLQQLHAVLSNTPNGDALVDTATVEQLLMVADRRAVHALVDTSFGHARIIVLARDQGTAHFGALRKDLSAFVDRTFEGQVQAEVNGETVIAAEGLEVLGRDLGWGMLSSTVLITLVLALALRSIRLALVSVLPNVLPVATICAVYSLLGRHLDPVAAISFTVVLGIAVDDTVHLLSRHQVEARRLSDRSAEKEAAASAVAWSFRPVVLTTVALALGFSVLSASGFPPNRTFGLLVASGLGLALASDLLITPALLVVAAPRTGGTSWRTYTTEFGAPQRS